MFYPFGNHFFFICSRWHRLHSCPDGEFIELRQIQRLFFPVVRWPWKSRKMDKNRVFAVPILEQNPGRSARVQSVLNCVLTCVMILKNFDKKCWHFFLCTNYFILCIYIHFKNVWINVMKIWTDCLTFDWLWFTFYWNIKLYQIDWGICIA